MSSQSSLVQAQSTPIECLRQLISGISSQNGQASTVNSGGDQSLIDLRGLLAQHIKTTIGAVAELNEDDTRALVNFLDQTFKDRLTDQKERTRALALLSRIVATTRVFPKRLILDPIPYNHKPKAVGGSGAVHQGIDPTVCVKVMLQVDSKAFGPWIREMILWAHSSHPNLLPFTGMFFEDSGGIPQICLVSPFMENGNLTEYAPRLPQKSRFPLLSDVANGLQFIHEAGIVHSDLKGQNVLITDRGRAVITDFGSSRVTTTTTVTTTASSWTLCYAAPELVVEDKPATRMSDIWSFGCLCYEALSRKRPYHQYTKHFQLISAFSRKEPPQRPGATKLLDQTQDQLGLEDDEDSDEYSEAEQDWDAIDDVTWSLIMRCCAPISEDRPTVLQIQELLEEISTSKSKRLLQDLLSLLSRNHIESVSEAVGELDHDGLQTFVEFLDQVCRNPPFDAVHTSPLVLERAPGNLVSIREDRNRVLGLLLMVASSKSVIPRCYELKGIRYSSKPMRRDVLGEQFRYSSERRGHDMNVCVYLQDKGASHIARVHIKWAILWAHLSHPTVSPFYGVLFEPPFPSVEKIHLVYPFMENGYLIDYAPNLPQKSRLPLISDVAAGLHYLHESDIIHASLDSCAALISSEGRALITVPWGAQVITPGIKLSISSSLDGNYAAPEVMSSRDAVSKESDIWSFGCLCYRILSGYIPYSRAGDGPGPKRPDPMDKNCDFVDDRSWDLIMRCCVSKPEDRLDIIGVRKRLEAMEIQDDRPAARKMPEDDGVLKLRTEVELDLELIGDLLKEVEKVVARHRAESSN